MLRLFFVREVLMFYDTHTHLSPYSHDASQTLDRLLADAARSGLSGVMTADHYEKDMFYEGWEDVFDVQSALAALEPRRAAHFAAPCKYLIGIEMGYVPHLVGHLAELTSMYPFDGVILSLHMLGGRDPYHDHTLYDEPKAALYGRYLRQMAAMVADCPNSDIIGHFDYIGRYAAYPDRKLYYRELADDMDLFLRALIDGDKALEINTRSVLGLRRLGYGLAASWPDPAIIRRYLDLGGEKITLGSDAHAGGEAGQLFEDAAAWLESLGCRWLTHFERRRAILERI
jgi:histidinol-phosphatase (PHP family)